MRLLALILIGPLATALPAQAADLLVTSLGGAVQGDPDLDHYRWDVRPQAAWGLEGTLGDGPWRAGVRAMTWTTEQGTGLPDVAAPGVRLAACQASAERRLATVGGTSAWAAAAAGILRVTYSPDRIDVNAGGTPQEVRFAPMNTAIGGLALSVRRPLSRRLEAGLEGERFFYSLETAHRSGDAVVTERETFANWAVRLRLTWWIRRS